MILRLPAAALAVALAAMFTPGTSVIASERVTLGDHTIYATALSSLLIPPEVAQLHGIVRSAQRIVVNVTVLETNNPAAARVSGTGTNLLAQQLPLEFAEVREQGAIYYLASIITNEKDTIRFKLQVLPAGAAKPAALQFERSYFPKE